MRSPVGFGPLPKSTDVGGITDVGGEWAGSRRVDRDDLGGEGGDLAGDAVSNGGKE